VTSLYVPEVIRFIKNYKFSLEEYVHVHDYDTREKKRDLHIFLCKTKLFKKIINMGI